MRYDVVVVGGGPAGSTVARECARLGLTVAVLERAAYPRDKPCGGGVNVRAAQLLPFDLAPVTEQTIFGARVSHRFAPVFERQGKQPLALLTQRRRLDAYLMQHAVDAGVRLYERARVTGIECGAKEVTVRTDGWGVKGRYLAIADGVNGQASRLAGFEHERRLGVAFEGNFRPEGGVPPEWRGVIGLDFGNVPGGYGWLFPKGDHLNIGVGGYRSAAATLREHFQRLARSYGFDPGETYGARGYHLPMGLPGAQIVSGNALLVGDAAGFVDPLSGEGIYGALWSGCAAARHLAACVEGRSADLVGYQCEVEERLMPELSAGSQLFEMFHRSPRTYLWLAKAYPGAWSATCKAVRGETGYQQLGGGLTWRLFRSIDAGLRLAGRSRGTRQAATGPDFR